MTGEPIKVGDYVTFGRSKIVRRVRAIWRSSKRGVEAATFVPEANSSGYPNHYIGQYASLRRAEPTEPMLRSLAKVDFETESPLERHLAGATS